MKKAIGTRRIIIASAIVVAICAVGLWLQRDIIKLYTHQWLCIQKHCSFNSKGNLIYRKPILRDRIARQDPQAACLVKWFYQKLNRQSMLQPADGLKMLSELSLRYPDNPFFLYELTCRLAIDFYIDPYVIDCMAERLLQIDPGNGRYYALKAWAALYDWDENRVEKALSLLHQCFTCPKNIDPYEYYRQRVDRLMEAQNPPFFVLSMKDLFTACDGHILHQLTNEISRIT